MSYRIHFNEHTGRFVIQVLRYWFFWRTVNFKDCVAGTPEFSTYEDALKHVDQIGLSQLYRDRSANMYHAYMNA